MTTTRPMGLFRATLLLAIICGCTETVTQETSEVAAGSTDGGATAGGGEVANPDEPGDTTAQHRLFCQQRRRDVRRGAGL